MASQPLLLAAQVVMGRVGVCDCKEATLGSPPSSAPPLLRSKKMIYEEMLVCVSQ